MQRLGLNIEIRIVPVVALPPACSTTMARGFLPYINRSFPSGLSFSPDTDRCPAQEDAMHPRPDTRCIAAVGTPVGLFLHFQITR